MFINVGLKGNLENMKQLKENEYLISKYIRQNIKKIQY